MRRFHLVVLTAAMIPLMACQRLPAEKPVAARPAPAAAATESPEGRQDAGAPRGEVTAVPATATPATATPEAGGEPPAPTLLPFAWDERDVFKDGLIPGSAGILPALSESTVYHLALDITDPTLVQGKMEALYTNQDNEPLSELVLHLFPEQLGGEMAVADIRISGNPALPVIEPGILRLPLERPLEPGEQVVVSMGFVTTVPDGEESTKYNVLAYDEGILALAHFYPMFAAYDDQGWHTEPSADHGDETYSDTSFYLVEVEAPEGDVLVTSGVELSREVGEGVQRALFAAGPMRDFYLASSDRFEAAQQRVGPVLINSYAPPGQLEGAQVALDVAASALQGFGDRFGAYPYIELDIVSTPTGALGVEYPGIFANALRIYDLAESSANGVPNKVLLESTTAHETAHQWFYGLVGNDQLNEPWLDEALTQYATWLYFVDRYGEQNAQGFFENLEARWAGAEDSDKAIGLPADAYSGRDYGAIVYGRGPIFLNELAGLMGQESFDAFLRDYSEQYRWKIAGADDFLRLAEQHCACDLSEVFAEQVFGR